MAEAVDYFTNHRVKFRFPWSLYHGPIIGELRSAVARAPGPEILNVGSGPFFELPALPATDRRYTICDIDARAIELARSLHGDRLARADLIAADAPLPYPDASFDLVASMDVIEHTPDATAWMRELVRVTRPTGALFLTTPNYRSLSLRLLEATALEAIARTQGFSRRHLHPSKFDEARLRRLFSELDVEDVIVRPIAFGWVLAAHATRRPR